MSIIKKLSQEKAQKVLQGNNWLFTEDGDDFDVQSRERISEVLHSESNQKKQNDGDKDSNSDENSEKLVLRSSSTEYNFYNSDDSRGPSIVSSSSSQFNPFRKPKENKNLNGSLGIVKEVSNNAIEEDPDEDMKTSKDTSSKNPPEITETVTKEESFKQEQEQVGSSNSSQKSDVNKIVEYMKDLVDRCSTIISFYSEKKNQEPIVYKLEMAYLLNKIWYELKEFMSTFTTSANLKNDSSLQIVNEANEQIDITVEMIRSLKSNKEYKSLKIPVTKYFLSLTDQLEKMHDSFDKMDRVFQMNLSNNLLKFAIDLVQEAYVLDEEERKDEAVKKYTQALFIMDELLAEKYKMNQFDFRDSIKMGQSNSGSQCDNSEVVLSSSSNRCKNEFNTGSQTDNPFEAPDFKQEKIV